MSQSSESNAESVIALLRRIQQDPALGLNLSVDERRRCVEHLTGLGHSPPEISQILSCSDRTISRDRSEIRRIQALHRDPNLVPEIVGQLQPHYEHGISNLRASFVNGAWACGTGSMVSG